MKGKIVKTPANTALLHITITGTIVVVVFVNVAKGIYKRFRSKPVHYRPVAKRASHIMICCDNNKELYTAEINEDCIARVTPVTDYDGNSVKYDGKSILL